MNKEVNNLLKEVIKKEDKLSLFACYYESRFKLNNFESKEFQRELSYFLDGINKNKNVDKIVERYKKILEIPDFEQQKVLLKNTIVNGILGINDLSYDVLQNHILPYLLIDIINFFDNFIYQTNKLVPFLSINIKYFTEFMCSKNLKIIDFGRSQNLIPSFFIETVFKCSKNLNHVNVSRNPNINDSTFEFLPHSVTTLDMTYCSQETITDNAFKYFSKIKNLIMMGCSQKTITDKAFTHLKEISHLNVSQCRQLDKKFLKNLKGITYLDIESLSQLTGEGFKYLKGIQHLYMAWCDNVTDESFKYLKGIYSLDITACKKITGKGLKYLKGIYLLNMGLNKDKILDKYIIHLKGIHYLNTTIFPNRIEEENVKNLLGYLPKEFSGKDYWTSLVV